MKESNSAMIKLGTAVNIITAVMFTLFTAYQIYLAVQMESNKTGRRAGIVLYLTITAASFLAFSYSHRLQRFRSGLMLVCLALLTIWIVVAAVLIRRRKKAK